MDMSFYFISAQLVGLLAMSLDIYATTHKSDVHLTRWHSLSSFSYAIHFFMLGANSGMYSELLNGCRVGLSAYTKSRVVAFCFIGIYLGLLLGVPERPHEAIPFVSSLFITIGLYFFAGVKMRLFYLIGFALWLLYSLFVLSFGGVISYSVLIFTTLLTIRQLLKEKKFSEKTMVSRKEDVSSIVHF